MSAPDSMRQRYGSWPGASRAIELISPPPNPMSLLPPMSGTAPTSVFGAVTGASPALALAPPRTATRQMAMPGGQCNFKAGPIRLDGDTIRFLEPVPEKSLSDKGRIGY